MFVPLEIVNITIYHICDHTDWLFVCIGLGMGKGKGGGGEDLYDMLNPACKRMNNIGNLFDLNSDREKSMRYFPCNNLAFR